ncbi:uncharacterized protein LOC144049272 [Vanacampus margaritifer]
MLVHFCLCLLALSFLTSASAPTCEEILAPPKDWNLVPGRWILYAGLSDYEKYMNEHKKTNSSWMDFSPVPNTANVTVKWGNKIAGLCFHGTAISSYSNSSANVEFVFYTCDLAHYGKHLKTCPDCLLWIDETVITIPGEEPVRAKNVFLMTKSGRLDDDNLAIFKKQLTCLNFTQDFHVFDTSDLCPEETTFQEC